MDPGIPVWRNVFWCSFGIVYGLLKIPNKWYKATITVRLLGFKALFDMYYIWIILVI